MPPTTLEMAQRNALTDYDPFVIDVFRRNSALLDMMEFDQAVNPAGGGATLTYGYRRLKTRATAGFRALNAEYGADNIDTEQVTVNLKPLGGKFSIDRALANIGPAASNEVALQMTEKVKAAAVSFVDEVINGDTAVRATGFDGLDKALKNSSTELNAGAGAKDIDLTDMDAAGAAHKALDMLDDLFAELNGTPSVIICNKRAMGKLRAAARRANQFVVEPVAGLADDKGNPVQRTIINGVVCIDPGEKAGSGDLIIPTTAGKTSIYVVRLGLDAFHGVTVTGQPLVQTWLPDYSTAGAVKIGEVEMGPLAVALKNTRAAAVLRNVKVG